MPSAGQDVFLRLKSNNGTIRLYKLGTKQDYAWQSYEIDEQNGISRDVLDGVVATPPLIIMENTKDVEALWTFVSLADAWYYMKAQSGRDPGELTAYWSPTSQDGPRYDGGTRELFFRNDNDGYTPMWWSSKRPTPCCTTCWVAYRRNGPPVWRAQARR